MPYRPPPIGRKLLEITGPARADMDEALAHLAREVGIDIAVAFADRLDAELSRLAVTGHAGVSREWLSPGLRMTVVGNFSVYFRVTVTQTIIIRVLRGSRDVTRISFDQQ